MRHALIDKRIAGIIRWLERLNQSYSSGAMESALIEAECARADLEILRADVWKKISVSTSSTRSEHRRNKILSSFVTFSKIGFLTVLIVLLAVIPISKEPSQTFKTIEEDKTQIVLAKPIEIIYEEPVKKFAKVPENSQVNSTKNERKNKTRDIQTVQKTSVPSTVKTVEKVEKVEKKVAYDELFSLMQTGQKALKNHKSIVKISN